MSDPVQSFSPAEGAELLTVMDGFDAMLEFVLLNYGPLVDSSEGLSNLASDIDRSIVAGGFPPDESTWGAWVSACRKVKSRSK